MNKHGLNDEQMIAVGIDGNILLTACPGSGKTRVIIHKLVNEIEKLPIKSKKKVVSLTYTVRASEEIIRRLNNLGVDCSQIWTGTIHSFCLEWIIRPYGCYLAELKKGFTVADEAFCAELITELKKKHGINQLDSINQRINRDGSFVTSVPEYRKLLKEYHQLLFDRRMVDFELILYHSYRILAAYPKICQTIGGLICKICVDEYQDTQDLQYGILSKIVVAGNGETTIFFVGDIDQAIYTSLGGVAKELHEIETEITPHVIKELSLTGNYRSNQRIIDFYRNFQTKPIPITSVGTNRTQRGIISLNRTINCDNLAEEIARLIQISIDKGVTEDEICVLVPQWWLITKIARKLKALIPTVNFDASGLAPMSKNRDNIWYKLSRLFLTHSAPRLYSARYRWATEIIHDFRIATNIQILDMDNPERLLLKLVNSIQSEESEGIDFLKDSFTRFMAFFEIQLNDHPILKDLWDLFFKGIESRLKDQEFNVPSDTISFKSFYREMTGVVINTCVGVKGEEFETVIAYGLLHGYIPHWNEVFHGNPDEASKKLMYVICSRAKTNLHLISERGRKTKSGKSEYQINSQLAAITFDYDVI